MSHANFLEKLLDGVEVEWKKLGEVAKIQRGRSIVIATELANPSDWLACFRRRLNHLSIIKDHYDLHSQEKQVSPCFSWYS